MKARAAVARRAGEPLSIETVELEGPQQGEVLVEIKATGVCHTDAFTLSGKDPEGLFPAILGHEGAGVVVDVGPGVREREEGRPRDPALHAGVPRVLLLHERQDQPLPGHPRHAGQGRSCPTARAASRSAARRLLHYMGTSTFASFTVLPEIAVAKIREDAPFDKVCYIGCGVTTGHRRGHQHREGAPRRQRRRLRPRRHRPQRRAGRAHGRRGAASSASTSTRAAARSPRRSA